MRADIQGLRAVAVLLVIADHLFANPSGGFVGVDIFFVISGFLITGLLLREQEKSGGVSFTKFYRRRVRRILPLAVLVLGVTVAASWVVFLSARAMNVTMDALWSALFAANWHFAINGTDYLQADGPVSPLQHFWSLSVEEQFYVVWPWLVVLGLGPLASRMKLSRKGRAVMIGTVMLTVSVVSLGYAMWETHAATTVAYFSTFSRAWELGFGALLAVAAPLMSNMPAWLRAVLGWAGLGGIALSAVAINSSTPFPAPGALLPVVATVLVIAAGTGATRSTLVPLTNRVSGYIGDISYSLYLWHFPVVVLLGALMPADSTYYLAAVCTMAVLSVLSYHFVEDPIRRSSWLEPGAAARRGRKAPRKPLSAKAQLVGLGALALLTVVMVAAALIITAPRPSMAEAITPAAPSAAASASAPSGPQSAVMEALAASEWPALTPDLASVASTKAPELEGSVCLNPSQLGTPDSCNFGTKGDKTAVVVGDSIAVSWIPGVREALEPKGYFIHGVALSSCPFANVAIVNDYPGTADRCNSGHAAIYKQIVDMHPDLVVVSDATIGISKLASKATGVAAEIEWASGLTDALKQISGSGARVVILAPNPPGQSPDKCATKFSKPKDCVSPISDTWRSKRSADTKGAAGGGAKYVDTSSWFCSSSGACPIFASGVPVRWDGTHLTEPFSKLMAPQISEALASPASP